MSYLRQIWGVMLLSLRAAIRAKMVIFLILAQVLCALVLPRVIKGDGTAAGELEILLTYALGLSFGIQALATLWSSCSLFASEISSFRIQLAVVKPVHFPIFWLGRWLALLLLNGVLLLFVYTIVYFQLRWVEQNQGWEPGIVPSALHVSPPILPTAKAEARQIYSMMQSKGELPEGLSEAEVLATLEEQAAERYDIINPGNEVVLNFQLARAVRKGENITLRFRFDTEYSTRAHVKGLCRLELQGQPTLFAEHQLESVTQNEIRLEFAADPFVAGATAGNSLRDFVVILKHTGADDKASALLLRFRQDVVLMIPGKTFESNLLRCALVQGSVLALLAAFGLTLSAVFSFPVAAFAATVVLALIMIGGGVLPLVSKEDEKKWENRMGVAVLRAMQSTTRHISEAKPLRSVVRGELIAQRNILISVFWNMGVLPLALAILACAALRRRELANV
ncbi:MAG: hypothetical protein PHO37_09350 [Kiritimatiellae bacterium]|nr:hypothetical protein [Kiritimatiellia bacterium]